jgi:uncharacterized protein YlxW (UPF0749 family)
MCGNPDATSLGGVDDERREDRPPEAGDGAARADAAPADGGSPGPERPVSMATRIGFGVGIGLLGVLLVTSARSEPAEARLGQRVDLVHLIEQEQARNAVLAARVEELSAQVAALGRGSGGGGELALLQERIDGIAAAAGTAPVAGPGLAVTLRDARVPPPADADYNSYIIHEQDLQGVINALWSGGAEAMTVNGNRILATTAIRCVGNVLLLHGTTHSPPYVIEAIGDEVAMADALGRDPAVQRFAEAAKTYQLGFAVEPAERLLLPGYEGAPAMQVARPAEERS